MTEAEFVVFLTYIVNFVVSYPEDCEEDQYAMQDNMFNYVRRKELNIDKLACLYTEARKCFTDADFYYRYGRGRTPLFRKFFNKFSNINLQEGIFLEWQLAYVPIFMTNMNWLKWHIELCKNYVIEIMLMK